MKYNYIAIEGIIGAGKTTLARKIADRYNAKLVLEQFADNPFLPKFYEDQEKYAFPLEMSFLAERYQQLKDDLAKQDLFKSFTVADYAFEKSLVFAQITLSDDEFILFSKLFHIINSLLPKPDLLVYLYLDVHNARENITRRGRDYEQSIQTEYLDEIQSGYFNFLKGQSSQRILLIDINNIDFVGDEKNFQQIIDLLNRDYETGIHRAILSEQGEFALTAE